MVEMSRFQGYLITAYQNSLHFVTITWIHVFVVESTIARAGDRVLLGKKLTLVFPETNLVPGNSQIAIFRSQN